MNKKLNDGSISGEGEEWAERAAREIPGGHRLTVAERVAIILKHFAARPTAARADTARLDWLEKNAANIRIYTPDSPINCFPHCGYRWQITTGYGNCTRLLGAGDSLRAAIDAARSANKGKE